MVEVFKYVSSYTNITIIQFLSQFVEGYVHIILYVTWILDYLTPLIPITTNHTAGCLQKGLNHLSTDKCVHTTVEVRFG